MHNPSGLPRTARPRLTLAILRYALVDVLGMVLFAVGAAYLARGPGVFFDTFPDTTASAVIAAASGLLLMFWAAARILREVARQTASGSDDDRD